jgi:uncharacterized protein YdhG (YjbR/CyaY superfamily)
VPEIDRKVRDYIDAIAPKHYPLFERVHRLILLMYPNVSVVLSYNIPTYHVGTRRLHIGVWKHGLSLYGWPQGREEPFIAAHPALKTSKGTIQVRVAEAATITDDELRTLISAALQP